MEDAEVQAQLHVERKRKTVPEDLSITEEDKS